MSKKQLLDEINRLEKELEDAKTSLQRAVEKDIESDRQALEASEHRFRLAAQCSSDLIWEWDIASDELLWFGDIDGALGFAPGEFKRDLASWFQLIHKDDQERLAREVAVHRESGDPLYVEYRIHQKDGAVRYWVDRGAAIKDEQGAVCKLIGACKDVTEQKAAEKALKENEALLQATFNATADGILVVDSNGTVATSNRQFRQMWRIPDHIDAHAQDTDLRFYVHDQLVDPKRFDEKIEQLYRSSEESLDLLHFKDGRVFERFSCPLVIDGKETGRVWDFRDVTKSKKAADMMIQTEKMMSIGGLAAGMAHEINNPLAGIIQNAQLITMRLTSENKKNREIAESCGTLIESIEAYMAKRGVLDRLHAIHNSGVRASRIVDNMLSFSRKSSPNLVPHQLIDLLEKTLELAANEYNLKNHFDFKRIEVVRDYGAVPPVPCEPSQIQQVMLNILKNGAEAMFNYTATPRFILRLFEKDGMAQVEIEDNGPGMDEPTQKRTFEPFFTTKNVGIGTGLGMSVSYFIITENHKGTISASSVLGQGTNFIIRIPLA